MIKRISCGTIRFTPFITKIKSQLARAITQKGRRKARQRNNILTMPVFLVDFNFAFNQQPVLQLYRANGEKSTTA
jgi:hypothetical protein